MTAIIIRSPKYGEMEALISTRNLQKADEFQGTWHVSFNKVAKTFYVNGNMPRVNGKRTKLNLHRWITNAPDGMFVDHINHNPLDNTDSNIRIITNAENQQNRNDKNSNNTSGVRNVIWCKQKERWEVVLIVKRKRIRLGFFKDIKDAELVAIESRTKLMPCS